MQFKKKVFYKCLIAIFISLLVSALIIMIDGFNDKVTNADILIVLGNKVNHDGEPSLPLKARLDKAAELYHKKTANLIFVSGGIGREGFDEALVMSNYLIKMGVPGNVIIRDNQGVDTMATAKNSLAYMNSKNLTSAIIVTQYFHISRCKLAFKKVGITSIGNAHAEYFTIRDFYSIFREIIAYIWYLTIKS